MNWTKHITPEGKVSNYGLKSGPWLIGKILSGGVPRYVLSKPGGDSICWFATADEAKQMAEDLEHAQRQRATESTREDQDDARGRGWIDGD